MSNTNNTDNSQPIRYTQEQKIVTAVWFHERKYNQQSFEDIQENFQIRFNTAPPASVSVFKWEKALFSTGTLHNNFKLPKMPKRLKYIPFVEASLKNEPSLSVVKRAKRLGISEYTLTYILKYDLGKTVDVQGEVCEPEVEETPE